MATAAAPGWLEQFDDASTKAKVEQLRTYLRTETPPHDFGRVLLLWAATRMPDLLTGEQKQAIIAMILKHQRSDGGWSIRTFAAPEKWGRGNRAEKLRGEPELSDPASDGHQTGLAIVVLRQAGLPANDEQIERGIAWLLKNQRQSGRWWTRSLNTDGPHYITYSGTALPLLALELCGKLPSN
jgi:squalene-hopene/tetraprenyl-beta-curcumene cyclase